MPLTQLNKSSRYFEEDSIGFKAGNVVQMWQGQVDDTEEISTARGMGWARWAEGGAGSELRAELGGQSERVVGIWMYSDMARPWCSEKREG